jgi:hypothetical protein
MTDYKVSQLSSLAKPLSNDLMLVVDVNDTSTPPAGSGGSDKSITMSQLAPSLQLIYVDQISGVDPTGGSDSSAAIRTKQTALGTSSYLLVFGQGTYLFNSAFETFGPNQGVQAPGQTLTSFTWSSAGPLITASQSTFNDSHKAGAFSGFAIVGPYGGGSVAGIKYGNLQAMRIDDVGFNGLDGGAIIGYQPSDGWAEQSVFTRLNVDQCGATNGSIFSFNGTSFDYSEIDAVIDVYPGVDVVSLSGTAQTQGLKLALRGNAIGGAANTGAIVSVDRGNTAGESYCTNAVFEVSLEADAGAGTVGHWLLWMGSSNPTSQFSADGVFNVYNAGAIPQGVYNPSFVPAAVSGITLNPSGAPMDAGDASAVIGGVVQYVNGGASSPLYENNFYSQFGNMGWFQLASGNNALTVDGLTAWGKDMIWAVQQPSSGGAGTITLPSGITWAAGSTPSLQTANNATDLIRVSWFGTMGIAALYGPPSSGGGGGGSVGGTAYYATTAGTAYYSFTAGTAYHGGTSYYATTAGTAYYSFTAGTAYLATSATSAISAGTAYYGTTAGTAYSATSSVTSGTAYYATTAGTAYYGTSAGTSYYSLTSGTAYAALTSSGTTTSALTAGTAYYATTAGTAYSATSATSSLTSGTAYYGTNAGTAYYSLTSGTAYAATLSIGTAFYSLTAGTAYYGGTAFYAYTGGTASYSLTAGTAYHGGTAYYATTAGTAYSATTSLNFSDGATLPDYLAPATVALTASGTSVAVNAALGNAFNYSIGTSSSISNPTNPVEGQVIRFRLTSGGATFITTWGTSYDFGAAGAPTLSTTSAKVDIVAFEYVNSLSKWACLGSGLGY